MFNQYFGDYLLKKKFITPEQLRIVLEEQKAVKVKLGILAIDAGYMDAAQVNRVHKLQTAKDKRFGELAVEEGYMTEGQLDELLTMQKKSNVFLGQALIEKGYFTFEKYEAVLIQYKEESGLNNDEIKALKNNNIEKIVEIFFRNVSSGDSYIYRDYFELFIRNLVRFIDDEVRLDEAREIHSFSYDYLVTQRMEGKHNLFTGFAGAESVMAKFASIYAKEECGGMDALARDSLGEFMNCQNGLFLSNLSHKGVELELYPSEVRENGTARPVGSMYLIPCYLSFGKIDFIFADGIPEFV